MLAATYTGHRTIEIGDRPLPKPGRGEVRIDVAYTGICGTDLHILHGEMDSRVTTPAVLGHEMSGIIAEVGDGTEGWQVGQGVTVMPLLPCGDCPACRAQHSHICHRLVFVGIDSPGAMQASWVVPQSVLVPLPDGMDLLDAALVEPTAVAVHDVRRASIQTGEKVLVVGGGPIGLLIAQVAALSRGDVAVVELDGHRRSMAEDLGFTVWDPTSEQFDSLVAGWTDGAGPDVTFEVSGAAGGLDAAVRLLSTRGRLVLVAIHSARREIDLHRFFWRELDLLGARLYTRADVEEAVRLVSSGNLPVAQLVSKIVPLSKAADAFAALDTGAGVMKVLISCQEV